MTSSSRSYSPRFSNIRVPPNITGTMWIEKVANALLIDGGRGQSLKRQNSAAGMID
jgi:hypothetical protein